MKLPEALINIDANDAVVNAASRFGNVNKTAATEVQTPNKSFPNHTQQFVASDQ